MIVKSETQVAPGIFVYDNVINNSQELISLALSTPEKWRDSRISNGEVGGTVNKNIRNTKILDVPATFSNDIKWFEVSQIIWNYANQYALDFEIGFSGMEPVQLLHYSTQDGFYKPHADSGPEHIRIFSALLYLNDVKEGGETFFKNFDVSVTPKEGRLVLFPADYIYLHEAKTPKSEDKFCLVTWFAP